MTLKLFTLPVNVVIRYGVSTNTRYGIVMRVNVCHQLAPSILAASYWSAGMFCRMPVICMIVNGMPIHRFTTITVTRGPGRIGEERQRFGDPAPGFERAVDGALRLEHLVDGQQGDELRARPSTGRRSTATCP